MASKHTKLLLTENVDNLGIVGDVVRVRLGYARNFLLPMGFATTPSKDKLTELAAKRAQAEKDMAALRSQRQALVTRMKDLEITLERSVNDQGMLYGSVTQQDLAAALTTLGFPIKPREVRLPQVIKRLGNYDVTVKLASDMETVVKIWVAADRKMEEDRRDEAPAQAAPSRAEQQ
jgi:large subunit ribosomal protein L9